MIKLARTWAIIVAILATYSTKAFGDEPRVYFEKECLALLTSHSNPALAENETKVEEGRGMLRFEKTVVTESRDGVTETYVQIRNCSSFQPASH